MASVFLRFVPPDRDDLIRLHILESTTQTGTLNEIEVVTAIGSSPSWISEYTTDQATSVDDWFAIQWEDAKGAYTEISERVQGQTSTLVGEVVDQVKLRLPTVDSNIILTEALAAVETLFPAEDAAAVLRDTATYRQRSGLVMLAQALSMMAVTTTSASQWTAGLVGMRTDVAITEKQVDRLISEAAKRMGISYSTILQLAETEVAGGFKTLAAIDMTRLIVEIA